MDTTWMSSATGMFNYVYNSITGEDESTGYRSRNLLHKGMQVTDLPTNNYGPIETSHGARAIAKEIKRERQLEEKIAVLKAQCNAKSRENVCLQDKVSELQQNGGEKANELTKKLEGKDQLMKKAKKFVAVTKDKLLKKEGEVEELNKELLSMKGVVGNLSKLKQSLSSQVAELKTILAKREEIQKQQQQLIRELTEDTKKKLEKSSVNITYLTKDLEVCEANNSELRQLNSGLEEQLKEASCDNKMINDQLECCKAHENQLKNMNTSLKERLTEAQDKLEEMANQLQQKEQVNREKEELVQQVETLKSQLNSSNVSLKDAIQALDSCKELQNQTQNTVRSLNERLTGTQERLEQMANQLQQKEQVNREKEELVQQVATLKSQLNSSNASLKDFLQAKTRMTVFLDSCNEFEKQTQTTITSLDERLAEAHLKIKNMAKQLQQKKQISREDGELFRHVATLKSQLNSSNAALQDLVQAKNEMTALLTITKDNERELQVVNSSMKERLDQTQEKLDQMVNELQKREKINQEKEDQLSREIVALKSKLNSTNVALSRAKTEMEAQLVDTSKDVLRKQELEMMNMALKEHLVETQERLRQMPDKQTVQKRKKVSEGKEELERKIASLESQLSSSNAELQEVFQRKTEIRASLNISIADCNNNLQPPPSICPAKKIAPRGEHDIPVSGKDPIQTQQAGRCSEIYVSPFSMRAMKPADRADCNNILPPPPFICPAKEGVSQGEQLPGKDLIQTQQACGSSETYVNPFSMRAKKLNKAGCYNNLQSMPIASPTKRKKQLRPSSPFIPVSNLPVPAVTQSNNLQPPPFASQTKRTKQMRISSPYIPVINLPVPAVTQGNNLQPSPVVSPTKSTKPLRPSSPFIPVSNYPVPAAIQTNKDQKKNINDNSFSDSESQGFLKSTLKWFGL